VWFSMTEKQELYEIVKEAVATLNDSIKACAEHDVLLLDKQRFLVLRQQVLKAIANEVTKETYESVEAIFEATLKDWKIPEEGEQPHED
jgi:hypothetical protein